DFTRSCACRAHLQGPRRTADAPPASTCRKALELPQLRFGAGSATLRSIRPIIQRGQALSTPLRGLSMAIDGATAAGLNAPRASSTPSPMQTARTAVQDGVRIGRIPKLDDAAALTVSLLRAHLHDPVYSTGLLVTL